MADEVTVDHLVADLDLNRLSGIVEEVAKHIRNGNPDAAAMVLGTQSGKVGRFSESYSALREARRPSCGRTGVESGDLARPAGDQRVFARDFAALGGRCG